MKIFLTNFLNSVVFAAALLVAATSYSEVLPTGAGPQAGESAQSNVKSYHEWKKIKISEIEARIKNIKDRINNQSVRHIGSAAGKDPNLALSKTEFESGLNTELQKQLEQEMLSLSMSRDLTISDYFVGYLTKQTSLELSIKEVSARMTPAEVAELMVAFAEHFFQTRPAAIKSKLRADSGQ